MSSARVQCVLVLYKTALHESESFRTLRSALLAFPELAARVSLLIYDNSPMRGDAELPTNLCASVRYKHDAANSGLAEAYNYALQLAVETGSTWVWLFDQDTTVVQQLLPATFAAIDAGAPVSVSVIVPRLVQNGILLSPAAVHQFRNRLLPGDVAGILPEKVTALNACACLRVTALQAIGGFPQQYWLDFLDHAVFYRISQQKGEVLVLDMSIPHQLSTNNLRKESSHHRFGNLLDAEWRFVLESGWGGGTLLHRLRLLKRALRTLLVLHEPAFALQVLKSSLR